MQALGLRRNLGYGIGDFGLNLYWQSILLFIVFFHIDMLGLTAWEAGICFLIVGIWDAMMDPLVGAISDRTRTRMGRYRPFILFGAVPLAGAFTLCFSPPGWLAPGSAGMIAFALLSHMLLRSTYAVVAIPYSSLTAAITSDADERASLTGWRMVCAYLGATAVAGLLPLLATRFGAGGGNGYSLAASLIGGLAVLSMVICVVAVRERVPPVSASADPRGPSRGFLAAVARNGPLLRLMAATVLVQIGIGLLMRNLPYMLKYDLGRPDLAGSVLPWLTLVGVASVPGWVWLARAFSKRMVWLVGSAMAGVGCLGLVAGQGLWFSLACLTIACIGHTAHAVAIWSMLPDTVDFGEWRAGRRDEAKVYGIASCMLKLSLGASGIVSGWALDLAGFVPNAEQTPETLNQFRLLAALVPCLGLAGSMVVIWRYPLDSARHRRIQDWIGRRTAGGILTPARAAE